MKITVTQEHIDRGREQMRVALTCRTCPVAQALRDAGFNDVRVYRDEIYLWTHRWKSPFRSIATPPEVATWIHKFDMGHAHPFEFHLDVPS